MKSALLLTSALALLVPAFPAPHMVGVTAFSFEADERVLLGVEERVATVAAIRGRLLAKRAEHGRREIDAADAREATVPRPETDAEPTAVVPHGGVCEGGGPT